MTGSESRSERYSVKELEDFQQRFESLRREFHRQGIHSGQRGCEFALEAIRRYQMEVAQSSEITPAEDTKRLDWLQTHRCTLYKSETGTHWTVVNEALSVRKGEIGKTLREAVDAARNAK